MNELKLCVVCRVIETPIVYNINFKAVSVCSSCAKRIFIQEADWLVNREAPHDFKERKISSDNNDMSEICSDTVCKYCQVQVCGHFGNLKSGCFRGRKLRHV